MKFQMEYYGHSKQSKHNFRKEVLALERSIEIFKEHFSVKKINLNI